MTSQIVFICRHCKMDRTLTVAAVILLTTLTTICSDLQQDRVSRQLVYTNSGVFKFILGVGVPIEVSGSGHNLAWLTNLQGIYRMPDNITYFQPYRVVQRRSLPDVFTRMEVYHALKLAFTRAGLDGASCIMLLLCEAAGWPWRKHDGGLFADLLQILLAPDSGTPDAGEDYQTARDIGKEGGDCRQVYTGCPDLLHWIN